jgi:hypothetical protein
MRFVSRAFFLAYQASHPIGMRLWQAVDLSAPAKETQVFDNIKESGDYGGKLNPSARANEYYASYVFGRSLKLRICVKGECISVDQGLLNPDEPDDFPNFFQPELDLISATAKSLDVEVEMCSWKRWQADYDWSNCRRYHRLDLRA